MEQDFIRGWRREKEGGYEQDFGGLNGARFYPWLAEGKGRWIRSRFWGLKWSMVSTRGWRREKEGGYDQDFGGLNGA